MSAVFGLQAAEVEADIIQNISDKSIGCYEIVFWKKGFQKWQLLYFKHIFRSF